MINHSVSCRYFLLQFSGILFFQFSPSPQKSWSLSLSLRWDVVIIVAFGRLSGRQAAEKGNFFIVVAAAWMIIIDWKTARHPTTDSTVLFAIAFLLFRFCFNSSFASQKNVCRIRVHPFKPTYRDVCYVCNEVTQCRLVLRSERKNKNR